MSSMGDLLIRGVEMPKDNDAVTIIIFPNGKVSLAHDRRFAEYAEAVPVPPHGDLIDKQYAYQNTMVMGEHMRKIILKQIDSLPTVIPASEEYER